METIHLIDFKSKTHLLNDLLKEKTALINHRFISFNQAFYPAFNQIERQLQAIKTIALHHHQFKLLYETLKFKSSVFEALDFLDTLDKYGIPLSCLPNDTVINQEKTKLILLLAEEVERVYQNPLTPTEPIIVHPFYLELYQKRLLEKNNVTQAMQKPLTQPIIKLKTALNMRQEVTGVTQWLVEHPNESVLILIGDDAYIPIIKHQFKHAQLRPQFLSDSKIEPLFLATVYLTQAFLEEDRDALLQFLSLNLSNDPSLLPTLEVFEDYNIQFSEIINGLIDRSFSDDSWLQTNNDDERFRYQIAQQTSLKIAQGLQSIDRNNLYSSIFTYLSKISTDLNALIQLKNILEENYPLLSRYPIEDVFELTLLKERAINYDLSHIVVADFKYQPSTSFDTIIYLGVSQDAFLKPQKRTGLFNERYVSLIEGFDSLANRTTHHYQELTKNFTISNQLIFSYPQMDYNGKVKSLSFEIEQVLNGLKATPWTFTESSGQASIIQNLDSQIAERLFMKNGTMTSSISALQIYTSNSFQYFIERGLKVKKLQKLELNNATIGTLSHAVLERLTQLKNKEYVNATQDEIKLILAPTFNYLINLFPSQKHHLSLSLERLSENLFESLAHFKNYENTFMTTIAQQEYRFNKEKLFDSLEFYFTGIIDRIDLIEDGFIVIDYKSSNQSLSESNVKNGRQLQLPVYAIMMQKISGKPCYALTYFSFALALQKVSTFKLNTYGISYLSSTNEKNAVKHKWLLTPQSTSVKIQGRHMFDMDELEIYFEKLLTVIFNKIKSGELNQFIDASDYFIFNDTQRNQETYPSFDELYTQVDESVILNQAEKA